MSAPKFCSKCGKGLIKQKTHYAYDVGTGEQCPTYYYLKCPNFFHEKYFVYLNADGSFSRWRQEISW